MTIKYMKGFDYFPPEPEGEPSEFEKAFRETFPELVEVGPNKVGVDPRHIALVEDKYYINGAEIPAEKGQELLEKALKEGTSCTIFQPLRRN